MGFSLETGLSVEEITINKHGDKIFVSSEDATLFDQFVSCFDFIVKQSKRRATEVEEIEKKYAGKDSIENEIEMTVEMSRVNVEFSNDAVKRIDDIFGEGTVRKYFRDHYEKIPSFLPGVDCFMEFLDKISPVMEKIFEKTIKGREEASKARMAKYQPQDYKRKSTSK